MLGAVLVVALLAPVGAQGPTPTSTSSTMPTSTTTGSSTTTTTGGGSPTSSSSSTTSPASSSTTTSTTLDLPFDDVDGFDPDSELAGNLLRRMTSTPVPDLASPVGLIDIAELQVARAAVVAAELAHKTVLAEIERLNRDLRDVATVEALLTLTQQEALSEAAVARSAFEDRVAEAYIRGRDLEWTIAFSSEDANEAMTRTEMLEAVLEADEAAVADYFARRDALDDDDIELLDVRSAIERKLELARVEESAIRSDMGEAQIEVAVWEAGSRVMAQGFLFPVFGANSFRDSWGEPRSGGRSHKGVDIMAAQDTPLVASEDSRVLRMNSNGAGGIQLTLLGSTGLEYFYAHMSGYARGLSPGDEVSAGTIVGYVGQTGNAVGSHVHFEIRENGVAVNPYPLVRAAWKFQGPFILEAADRIADAGGPVATADDLVLLDPEAAAEGDFSYGDDDEEPPGLGEQGDDDGTTTTTAPGPD